MVQSLSLFWEFFITDFKLRYKHSFLGFIWVIIKPLSLFAISYVVWTSLLGAKEGFALYLMTGIFFMNFVNEGITFGLQSLSNKAHILLKVRFSREVVVFSAIAVALLNYIINSGIIVGAMLVAGLPLQLNTLLIAIAGALLACVLLLGIGLFLSILSIVVQDIRHIVELSLQLLFWATPVFYRIEAIHDERLLSIIRANPFFYLLQMIRSLVTGVVPSDLPIVALTIGILSFTGFGYIFFTRSIARVAERI